MAIYDLKFDAQRNRYVSDPPGIEIWFEANTMRFEFNDGRTAKFDAATNAFNIQPDGKLLAFNAAENQYVSDDGTIIIYFEAQRNVWVVNESSDPRFRVTSQITGSGSVQGTGLYMQHDPVTVTAIPSPGWALSTLTMNGVPITSPHSFGMPDYNVVIAAVFVPSFTAITTEAGEVLTAENGNVLIV